MSHVNRIILVGNLGFTPELQFTEKGHGMLKLSLATSRTIKSAEGEERKETSWHRATVWGKRAESCAKFLTKGARVYIEGELIVHSYEDKDGNKRKGTDVHVNQLILLSAYPQKSINSMTEESAPVAMAQ